MQSNSMTKDRTIPPFLYGTAWKEDETERLTYQALEAGFRRIDTANQRRHYVEAAVGKALVRAMKAGLGERSDFFIQTKFTHLSGQDHRLPYDPRADYGTRVRQSFECSLRHLQTDRIDAYLLHGPEYRRGLSAGDMDVWREMEALHDEGRITYLGISNVTLEQAQTLIDRANAKPTFIQNRCIEQFAWDADLRRFCEGNGIVFQGFSLLTANRALIAHPVVREIAEQLGKTTAQVLFIFALSLGILPLTGTSDRNHLLQDLECLHLTLDEDARHVVEALLVG